MTITFTDANGVEWTLCKWRKEPGGELRLHACEADLRAALPEGYALVRLTGEEASDDDLAAIEESAYTGEFGYAVEQRRALYLAGSASRQAEVDRLTAERDGLARGQDDLNKCLADAESELATTKTKLAEVYGKLSDAEYSKAKTLAARYEWERRANAAQAKLAEVERELDAMRRVVADFIAAGDALFLSTVGVKPDAQMASARVGWKDARRAYRDALASATSSQPANVDASVIASSKSISSSTKPATGDHDFSGQSDLASAKCRRCGVEPADYLHQPMPACVPANSMPDSVRETIVSRFRAGDSVALLSYDYGRPVEQIEAAIRSEMPRQEEPRPSGEQAKPSLLSPLPWSVGTAEAEADRAVLDADGDLVAGCESTKDARYIVSRCNAPEPSASVPRSEVEALRDEARQQRDDWERRLELIGADHAARSAALARYRVWGCVHEDLEALLAKSGGGE